MSDSILKDIKKTQGLGEDYTVFDDQIIMHINTAFSTLNQLGLGPVEGFMIQDDTAVWNDFLFGDPRLNNVKSYIALRVRLLFDPPTTSYQITAFDEQRKELEWRLNVQREDTEWVNPNPELQELDEIIDLGYP